MAEAVCQLDAAHDAAARQLVELRQVVDAVELGKLLGVLVFALGHALGRMHQEAAAIMGAPGAVFYVFAGVDDQNWIKNFG